MKSAKEIGNFGEECAARYLCKKGYNIIGRNFRCKFGEIDVIAEDDTHIVFVEVKTRRLSDFQYGRPSDAVDYKKRQRLINSSHFYMSEHPGGKSPRIDVIELLLDFENKKKYIRHIPAAVEDNCYD